MEALWQDLRFALRSLGRSRLFTAIAVATLALSVGAVTTVFSVVHAALFRPLPFAESHRLMLLYITATPPGGPTYNRRWSFPRYRLLRRWQPGFSDVATFGPSSFNLTEGEEPERLAAEQVSASYFPVLRARALIGRTFTQEEDSIPGAHPAAVLGYGLWQRRFAGDRAVLGKTVSLEGEPLTVVGVMPPGFRGLTGRAELWTPEAMAPLLSYRDHLTTNQNFLSVVGRLKDGTREERAIAELAVLGPRIQAELPSDAGGPTTFGATAVPLNRARVDPANRRAVLVLLGAVGFLLLIAAANLANLQLGRGVARRREIAVRLALGAGRPRLVRLLLGESTLLATGGAIGGVLLAGLITRWLAVPERVIGARGQYGAVGEFATAHLDAAVLGFAGLATLGTTALFGLLPALRATRLDLTRDLKQSPAGAAGGASPRGRRPGPRGLLVAAEVALAFMLCAGAGLMLKSFRRFQRADRGFDLTHLLTFRIQPSDVRYPAPRAPALLERVLGSIAAVPGVVSATVDAGTPFENIFASSTVYIAGRPAPRPDLAPPVTRHYVGPDHFRTLGIPLLRGRAFTPADRAGRPHVTIINRTAALRFWPGQDPIGQRVWFGGGSTFDRRDSSAEIVGVVGDVPYGTLEDAGSQASFYTPYLQFTYAFRAVMIRTAGDPLAVLPRVRRALLAAEPGLPMFDVQTMDQRLQGSWAKARFNAGLLGVFALLALGFAAMGIYGVMAHSVDERTREMGIRLAIGGAPRDIARMVVGQGMRPAGIGLAAGLAGALGLTRLIQSLLYDVESSDPAVYGALLVLLGGVALVAAWVPARRATRVDPLIALRAE